MPLGKRWIGCMLIGIGLMLFGASQQHWQEWLGLVVLAVGAAWNSDGEGGDRGTLGLSPTQDSLAREIYKLGKPVVLILEGGRPFAIDDYYAQSAAVLSAFFPGQAGGQAIADVLFGAANPGGRHTPHLLGEALSWHQAFQHTGRM